MRVLPIVPTPPSRTCLTADGRIKDTPANRALVPEVTSQADFDHAAHALDAVYADPYAILLAGDAVQRLQQLVSLGVRVDCIVTSPPYYGQRNYGIAGQYGLEAHPAAYLDQLVRVFSLCWDVLRDTGSLWVNLGDTYWSGKGAHQSAESKQGARRFGVRPQDHPGDGRWARPKQLLLLPHRLAIALQDSGWLVRNDNVWVKPHPVPDQVRDRCAASHEYVFHFTKSRWYYFNRTAVGRTLPSGRLMPPRDTWQVPPASGSGNHRATFSEELVRLPILATTPPQGLVLDPFTGSGTSMILAKKYGWRSIGIDISPAYCHEAALQLARILPWPMDS